MPRSSPRILAALRGLALSLIAACSIGAGALQAKPVVDPPLELLYAGDNRLIAGTLIEINPAGRLVLQRKDVLDGKPRPPEKIDVRVPPAVLAGVKLGERYIVGYATSQKDQRNPLRRIANPDGPLLIVSTGLDPALLHDTAQTRAILSLGRNERGRESRRLFDLLMKALAGSDRALQGLAAGQIAIDREIGERLRENGGQATVERIVRDAQTPANVRTPLLLAAVARPRDFGDWWQSAATDIVTNTPVDGYDVASEDPTPLVLSALELLDKPTVKVPPDALKRWVWSPNPPLVERASLMLRRQSPAQERLVIQQALADPNLPQTTRKYLGDHLRRLDRLDARLKARKDGTG